MLHSTYLSACINSDCLIASVSSKFIYVGPLCWTYSPVRFHLSSSELKNRRITQEVVFASTCSWTVIATVTFQSKAWHCTLYFVLIYFLKNGPISVSFCSFSSFSHHNSMTNWKRVDVVLGIRTWGHRMVGVDWSIEVWWPPSIELIYFQDLNTCNIVRIS